MKEEVKEVIWYINDNKVSGSDGYNSQFFKDNWEIVGDDVCFSILDFFDKGKMFKQMNYIIIILILKVKYPESVNEYRLLFYVIL